MQVAEHLISAPADDYLNDVLSNPAQRSKMEPKALKEQSEKSLAPNPRLGSRT